MSLTRCASVAAGLLVVWCLKRHYAGAPVDDLQWILAPTAQITGTASITYSYAPVPLPAGLPLALAGLAALALIRRRAYPTRTQR